MQNLSIPPHNHTSMLYPSPGYADSKKYQVGFRINLKDAHWMVFISKNNNTEFKLKTFSIAIY